MRQHGMFCKGTWQPTPCATTVTNPVGQQPTPTHHHPTPQQVGEPVEDDLEESEREGLIDTPEIIGPSLETFVQLPLPSTQPSSIPCPSPSQGQAPPQPSTPPPPPPPNFPPAAAPLKKANKNGENPPQY